MCVRPAIRVRPTVCGWPGKTRLASRIRTMFHQQMTSHRQTHLPPANRRPASKRVPQTPLATVGGCQRENKQALAALRRRRSISLWARFVSVSVRPSQAGFNLSGGLGEPCLPPFFGRAAASFEFNPCCSAHQHSGRKEQLPGGRACHSPLPNPGSNCDICASSHVMMTVRCPK